MAYLTVENNNEFIAAVSSVSSPFQKFLKKDGIVWWGEFPYPFFWISDFQFSIELSALSVSLPVHPHYCILSLLYGALGRVKHVLSPLPG